MGTLDDLKNEGEGYIKKGEGKAEQEVGTLENKLPENQKAEVETELQKGKDFVEKEKEKLE